MTSMLSTDRCLEAIRIHGLALADAAEGNFDTDVIKCPGWTVADLVWHVRGVHYFWGSIVDGLLADPDTVIESVEVGSGRALWVQGTHHLGLRDRNGNLMTDQLRLSDNVLLWESGDVTLRFESALDRDDSLRIARSAR